MRIAVLDDYQHVAHAFADWSRLGDHELTFFHEPLGDLAAALEPFDVVCVMRERTAFPAEVFDRLSNLRLLVTTGMRNAAIDMDAAAAHGVTVCGTEVPSTPTAELTWGLVLALARHIPVEDAGMRGGGWMTTVGVDLTGKTLGILGLGRLGSIVARYGSRLRHAPYRLEREPHRRARGRVRGGSGHEGRAVLDRRRRHDPSRAQPPHARPDRRPRTRPDEADRLSS